MPWNPNLEIFKISFGVGSARKADYGRCPRRFIEKIDLEINRKQILRKKIDKK